MSLLLHRSLQVLGGGGIVTLGAIGAIYAARSGGNPLVVGGVMALTGLCLLSSALAQLLSPRSGAEMEPRTDPKTTRKAQDHLVDAALQQIVKLIKEYVVLNSKYSDDIKGANSKLLQLPSRTDVQEIVVKLINTNLAMQLKVMSMAKELEESQTQIVSLRNNISEVGKIAMRDALTDLGNRRFFDETLRMEIERARQTGEGLCLAMADLDRFKSVNDRFGHVVGDHLLKLVAQVLSSHLRGPDIAARYGGEEFTLLFPGASLEDAARVVEKIRRDLESKRWVVGPKEERLGQITASFGIARLAFDENAESFTRRADAKLLEAKAAGRNRIVIDRPDQRPSRATVLID